MPDLRPLVILAGVAVVLAAATFVLRGAADSRRPANPELQFEVPAFPAEVSRPFSFGLRSLVADLTFLEAIQVHGSRKTSATLAAGRKEDRLLARLLNYTVDLDPQFGGAYRFAGTALPRHTTDGFAPGVIATVQLLEKGARERPDDWRIAFLLGFLDSFYLGRMRDAAAAVTQASRVPGSPRYLSMLATRLAADAGDISTGEQMAAAMEAQADEESTRREWHERRLDLRMAGHLREIEAAAARFKQRTGSPAPSVEALVAAHDLRAVPEEPHGGRYVLRPDGEATSTAGIRLRVRGRAGTQSGYTAQ